MGLKQFLINRLKLKTTRSAFSGLLEYAKDEKTKKILNELAKEAVKDVIISAVKSKGKQITLKIDREF